MTLRELIAQYRSEHGLSQRQFAVQCSLSNGYISMLEKGVNPKTGLPLTPTLQALKKLATGMGISLSDLISIADDMPVSLADDDTTTEPDTLPPGLLPLPTMKKIPRLGRIACGRPIMTEENFDGYDDIPESINADFSLICSGDSMINARIHDGDIVYIRLQEQVENGEIAAVYIDGETTLKRVYLSPGQLVLQAENPQYAPMVYTGQELENIRIIGKAVGFTSVI